MRFVPRLLRKEVQKAARLFPAVILTGPRRAGKTTLLQRLFPKASYHLLEDPDIISRIRADPRSFLEQAGRPAIFDEIQNAPELLNYVRTAVDAKPALKGQWLITGSQEAPLMKGVTESMAGRAAVLQLLPLSLEESAKVSLLRGGFPEALSMGRGSSLWFRSYLQTYLERDVRSLAAIRDLSLFRRFLSLIASRCGQILNRTDLAAPLGVSVPTISAWLDILEATAQILLIPPYFENFGKRLIKSPKLYFLDPGMACHLLGIDSLSLLTRSPFHGPLFEGFVASEIVKAQVNRGLRRELYYFRDQQGLEVDFIIPTGPGRLTLLEAKASRTPRPDTAGPLERLAKSIHRNRLEMAVVHAGSDDQAHSALRPGVRALAVDEIPTLFHRPG